MEMTNNDITTSVVVQDNASYNNYIYYNCYFYSYRLRFDLKCDSFLPLN